MKPSSRTLHDADFLSQPFVAVPTLLLSSYSELDVSASEFMVLLHILAASQIEGTTDISGAELANRCKMTSIEVMRCLDRLVQSNYLAVGERIDEQGAHCTYFDLAPLWRKIRGQKDTPYREWRKDPVTLFEEEFGRPLSGLELEQLRQWLEVDKLPEWMIIEALREAVYANKFAFKYIDRVLYQWQKNRIRTRQELENYRENFRAVQQQPKTSAPSSRRPTSGIQNYGKSTQNGSTSQRDQRYSAFYELFPDA
ncbi:DnaD domain-containing protein [Alicyclobacillus tolerans]|uniref:DNA replication protein n=2 Tax=Alicyclobacillus tolerans TaxID=90970 RepID=A0ABT9LV91_9BACL|nr:MULTISPECIES: DnaD domain protein [Alicyclobacillus]MDP9728170.1 DNA replication protein [Alicyclobacillus tengchongensis]QRF23394.1 DnaD domain protein [Alicyclobacillus sp. TC]SHJ84590.1 DNA replication protein DnaD [Alicyclobacillus montanus]